MATEIILGETLQFFAGVLASEATSTLKRKVIESDRVRWLKNKIGSTEINELTVNIMKDSIQESYPKNNPFKKVVAEFLNDSTNQIIISEWIINPYSYEKDKRKLNKQYAVNKVEEGILEYFVKDLNNKIKINRRKQFPPYAVSILDKLHNLQEEFSDVKETTGETLEIVSQMEENLLTKDDLASFMKEQGVGKPLEKGSREQEKVDEIQSLIEEGRLKDARTKAIELIDNVDENKTKLLCEINKKVANTYLNEELNQDRAIPYLEESVRLSQDSEDIYKLNALKYLLEGDLRSALRESEKLLKDTENVESTGLKANILWAMGKAAEAYSFLKEKSFGDNPKHQFNLSYAAFRNNEIKNALNHLEKLLKIDPQYSKAYELRGEIYSIQYQEEIKKSDSLSVSEDTLQKLSKAESDFTKAIEGVTEQEIGFLSRSLANRGIVNFWLERDEEAIKDLERSIELNPDDSIVLKNLAQLYMIVGAFDKALDCIQRVSKLIPDDKIDNHLIRINSEILVKKGQPDKAINLIKEKLNLGEYEKSELENYRVLIEAYHRLYQPDRAEDLILSLENKFPESVKVKLIKAKHLHLLGEFDQALESLEKVENKATGKEKVLIKLEKAEIFFDKKERKSFAKAAQIYGSLCNKERNSYLLRRHALSLFNSRNYKECLKVCERILERDGDLKLFIKLKAEILYLTQNFDAASKLFRKLSIENPDIVEHSVKYAVCLFRLNKKDQAYQVVRQVASRVEESASDFLSIAHTFASMGDYKDAAKYAHRAIEEGWNDPNINQGYIQIWLREIRKVDDIPERYIEKFHEVTETFNKRFPEYDQFFELIKTPKDDIDSLKEEILKRLPTQEWKENVHGLFQEKKYPVEFLSNATGSDLFATWKQIINHPSYGLYTHSGSQRKLREEVNLINKKEGIFIDTVSLFTLNYLNKLEKLTEIFETVFVPQSVVDTLNNIKELEEQAAESGKLSIYEKNGEIFKHETSSESVQSYIEELEKVIKFITDGNKKVKVIGRSVKREEVNAKREFEDYKESLGLITTDVLFGSKSKDIPFYSDDLFVRVIAKEEFEISVFGIRSVLEVMLEKNVITEKTYHNSLIKLIKSNYHFVNISTNTLKRLTFKNDFKINEEVLKVLNEFKRDEQSFPDLIRMVCSFLKWFWDTETSKKLREDWTFAILNSLTNEISKSKVAKTLIRFSESAFHPIDSIKKQKFQKVVQKWLQSQSII